MIVLHRFYCIPRDMEGAGAHYMSQASYCTRCLSSLIVWLPPLSRVRYMLLQTVHIWTVSLVEIRRDSGEGTPKCEKMTRTKKKNQLSAWNGIFFHKIHFVSEFKCSCFFLSSKNYRDCFNQLANDA